MADAGRGALPFIVVVGLLLPMVVLVVALELQPNEYTQLVEPEDPAVVRPVERMGFRAQIEVQIAVGPVEESVIASAPAWSGTVTDVFVGEGDQLVLGQPVVEVDGIVRPFAPGATPYFRELGLRKEPQPDGSIRVFPGPSGRDVDQLHAMLASLGFDVGSTEPGSPYGLASARAVREWARSLGDAANDGVFDPGLVVWSVRPDPVVGRIDATVGSAAPTAGAPLIEEREAGRPIEISSVQGERLDASDYVGWVLEIDGAEVPVGDRETLLDHFAGVPPEGAEIDAQMAGPEVTGAAAVPAGSVYSMDGRSCVVLVDGTGAPVELHGTEAAVVVVTGLPAGTGVVANPLGAGVEVPCSSR